MLVTFDGQGKMKSPKMTEVSDGYRAVGSGAGSYRLQANCYGTGNLTVKAYGNVVSRNQVDFFVGGTKENPEVIGTVYNKTFLIGGQMRLIKSEH